MKSTTFALLQALGLGALAAPAPKDTPKFDYHQGLTREQEGHMLVPGGMAPEVQVLKPLFQEFAPNSKRVKIRYGKYSLPKVSATTLSSILTGEQGTINTVTMGMKKPCTDECGLITMQAGLEYANGSLAEPTNGGWLHHIVMVASGAGRKDAVCGMGIERFFSSGNEKTPTAFGDVIEKKVKSVFPVTKTDSFSAQVELMNMIDTPLDVWITIDYEFIEGPKPADFLSAKALWLDVTNCGVSSVKPPAGKMQFKLASKKWTSAYDGEMLGVGGHLHDGGTNVNIYLNDTVMCNSKAEYESGMGDMGGAAAPAPAAAAPATANPAPAKGMEGMAGMAGMKGMVRRDGGPHKPGEVHIKQMGTCSALGPIKKGDTVFIDANYDFQKFSGMKSNKGSYSDVMGIAILYVAVKT